MSLCLYVLNRAPFEKRYARFTDRAYRRSAVDKAVLLEPVPGSHNYCSYQSVLANSFHLISEQMAQRCLYYCILYRYVSLPMLCFVCRVDNMYLSSLDTGISDTTTIDANVMLSAPTVRRATNIAISGTA